MNRPSKVATPIPKSAPDAWQVVAEEKKPRTLAARRPMSRPRNRIQPVRPPRSGPRRAPGWRNITAGDAADYGYKAYQMAKGLVRLINVEEKIFDVDGTGSTVTITSTPTVINLSNVAQGTDFFERVGNSIRPQSFRFAFSSTGSSAINGNMMRLLVVQDKENHGVDPTLGDVLAGLSLPILAPLNPETKQRFRILIDRAMSFRNVPDLSTSGTSTTYIVDRKEPEIFEFRLGGHIYYDDTAGADASNLEGAIFLMAVSLDAANGPGIRYTSRLTFTDN